MVLGVSAALAPHALDRLMSTACCNPIHTFMQDIRVSCAARISGVHPHGPGHFMSTSSRSIYEVKAAKLARQRPWRAPPGASP